ncbi:MAG: flagellar hook-associated protein FlgK [Proteobacteria bacterium]|nr:flagellar hook-associated protein FlgK [Pseudomonadota bacterium]
MTWDVLNIAQSGLNAAQIGVSVTGNNIANASTPGYNREVLAQVPAGTANGSRFIGLGTEVAGIQRVYSDVLTTQLRSTQSAQSGLDTFQTQISQLDSLFSDSSSGLASALQNFQAGIKGLAANPADPAYRQSALSSTQSLVLRFQGINSQLSQVSQGVDNQVGESITAINSLTVQIAQSNQAISLAQQSAATDAPPNNLLDHRDQLLLALGKQVKIDVTQQGGIVSVSFAKGEPLVTGTQAFALKTLSSPDNPSQMAVGQEQNGKTLTLDDNDLLGGGALGGLLQFSMQSLEPAKNALGQIAVGLAAQFNAQNKLGLDANGTLGGDIFGIATPQAFANRNNTSNAVLAASIGDASALTASDYSVKYDGSSYKVTRLADGNVLSNANALPANPIDGIVFSVASGNPAVGDEFLVRPTANGASSIALLTNDPAKLAAAAPVRTATATTNQGTGKISAGAVDRDYLSAPLAAGHTISLSYSVASKSFTLTPAAAFSVTANGASTSYPSGTPVPYTDGAAITAGGISLSITGSPADQDQFIISPNTGGTGDGRNANLLAALQAGKNLQGGSLGYQDAYAKLVNQVGNTARETTINNQFQTAMLTNITNAQQSQSGVNLDEEATNLLKYQRAYQASAKVISIANQMFDALFSIAG